MTITYRQCLKAYHNRKFQKCLNMCNKSLSLSEKPHNLNQILYLKYHCQTRLEFVDDLLDLDDVHLPDEQVVSKNGRHL
jgi:hypothetical protein